jgi:hypothetical protein
MSEKIKILIRYITFIPAAFLAWVLALFLISLTFKQEGEFFYEIGSWASRVLGAPMFSIMVGSIVFPLERKVIPIVILSLFWISFTVFLFMVYGGYIIPFEK